MHTAPQVKLVPLIVVEGGIKRGMHSSGGIPMMEHEEQEERIEKVKEHKSFVKLQDDYRMAKRNELKAKQEGRNKETLQYEREVARLKNEMKEAHNQ